MSAQHPSNQDRGEPEELVYEHMLRLLAMDREWEKHYNERLAHSRVFALVLFAGIAFGIQRINWVVGSWWVTLLAVLATGVAFMTKIRIDVEDKRDG